MFYYPKTIILYISRFYAGNLDLFTSLKFPHVTDDVFFHVTFLHFRIREKERVDTFDFVTL